MNIIVYKKTGCPWAAEMEEYLDSLGLKYDLRDIYKNPRYAREVMEKSGQNKSPTLDIDGEIVPDAGVEDVAKVLERKGLEV